MFFPVPFWPFSVVKTVVKVVMEVVRKKCAGQQPRRIVFDYGKIKDEEHLHYSIDPESCKDNL